MVDASELVAGIEPLELDDGALIESAIIVVKASNADGTATLHLCETTGMSNWEAIGMLYDALHGQRDAGNWDDD